MMLREEVYKKWNKCKKKIDNLVKIKRNHNHNKSILRVMLDNANTSTSIYYETSPELSKVYAEICNSLNKLKGLRD